MLNEDELQLIMKEINNHTYNACDRYNKYGKSVIPDILRHILRDNFGDNRLEIINNLKKIKKN